jgi:hypothetical protein
LTENFPCTGEQGQFLLVWIFRSMPMVNEICHFAKNRTNKKIIEFDLRSEFAIPFIQNKEKK